MTDQQRSMEQPTPARESRPVRNAVEEVVHFEGPPADYLAQLLRAQCEVAPAEAGAFLRVPPEGGVQLVTHHPPGASGVVPDWVKKAAETVPQVLRAGASEVHPLHAPSDLYGQPAAKQVLVVPVGKEGGVGVAAAFVIASGPAAEFARRRERLELTPLLVSAWELRIRDRERTRDLARLRSAMETLAAINENERFAGVAMALVNEVASRWKCERVGLGFLKGRYVKLKALSHTEKFSRKMKLVQDVEAAMEECIDQDVEVMHPAPADGTFVARAAKELALRHGPTAVLCLPLRRKGEPVAVLSLERSAEEPFTAEEVEALRLTCDLVTARVVALEERDKWIGARAGDGLKKGLGVLVGAKHTWAKLIALGVLALVIFLMVGIGMYRVEAPFTFEATEQAVIPAPFDSYLESVNVEPTSKVEANVTVLATLDTAELRGQLASSEAKLATYQKQEAAAMRDNKISDAQIARAEADKVRAEMGLLKWRISQAQIKSPLSGMVTKGDLKKQLRAPVKKGDVLFEVAPLESLRAVISVPEDVIADVIETDDEAIKKGGRATGELATTRFPEVHMTFVVERISPVAEVVGDRNIFKVRVRLTDTKNLDLAAGMEGSARIDVAPAHYAWIWTRRLVNWVRMKLWL